MKAPTGVDADTGMTQNVVGTAANITEVTQVYQSLQGEEIPACGGEGYTVVKKRPEHGGSR